jgi:hypothetical protein
VNLAFKMSSELPRLSEIGYVRWEHRLGFRNV